jgi:hypothetical protein
MMPFSWKRRKKTAKTEPTEFYIEKYASGLRRTEARVLKELGLISDYSVRR